MSDFVAWKDLPRTDIEYTSATADQWFRGSDDPTDRCPAFHPDAEVQCDLKRHKGDQHFFIRPVEWEACADCTGGPEYDPGRQKEFIVHAADCPRINEGQVVHG